MSAQGCFVICLLLCVHGNLITSELDTVFSDDIPVLTPNIPAHLHMYVIFCIIMCKHTYVCILRKDEGSSKTTYNNINISDVLNNINLPELNEYFIDKIGYINELNLEYIIPRLIKENDFNNEYECKLAINEYKKFLIMILINNNKNDNNIIEHLIPSKNVDKIWHKHILHTNKYKIDCNYLLNSNNIIYWKHIFISYIESDEPTTTPSMTPSMSPSITPTLSPTFNDLVFSETFQDLSLWTIDNITTNPPFRTTSGNCPDQPCLRLKGAGAGDGNLALERFAETKVNLTDINPVSNSIQISYDMNFPDLELDGEFNQIGNESAGLRYSIDGGMTFIDGPIIRPNSTNDEGENQLYTDLNVTVPIQNVDCIIIRLFAFISAAAEEVFFDNVEIRADTTPTGYILLCF